MIKLSIVGRASDGLPLAQGTRYVNEEIDNLSTYKQQGEFILREISRGALPHSRMIIRIDHHCFSYVIENGICFMTLTDSSYPQKLVFFFLQDLAKEFDNDNFDQGLIEKITKPYSFVRFGGIIGNIRRQYADIRTQANLSKLNTKCEQYTEIITEEFSQLVKRRNRYEMLQKLTEEPDHVSHIWGSETLEIIALKWTPIAILFVVAATLFWASLSIGDDYVMSGF